MRSILFLLALPAFGQIVELPAWSPGTLDIHQIHTGRGNAAFFVFPDGTTMLLDAGAVPDREGLEIGPQRPNSTRPPGEWIARYVQRFSNRVPGPLDYAVVTHYHDDHIGAMAAVSRLIPIATLIDRGLQPAPPAFPVVREYLDFRRAFAGAKVTLEAGRADQIVARKNGTPYPGFEVRNVAANGRVWTGRGAASESRIPQGFTKADQPTENNLSLALRIRYGAFDYYTGGDLTGVVLDGLPDWHDMETPVARAIGPVDVAVLNHHGWLDTTNPLFLATLKPRVVVIPAWHASHPDHGVMRRLRAPGSNNPDLFITSLLAAPRAIFGYLGASFKSTEGHVLVRVSPGGRSYSVMVLSDGDEKPLVTSVHGPYASR